MRTDIPHADIAAEVHRLDGQKPELLRLAGFETSMAGTRHSVSEGMCRLICNYVVGYLRGTYPDYTIEDVLTIATLIERIRTE